MIFFPRPALVLVFLGRAARERDWQLGCAAANVRYDPPGSMPRLGGIGRQSIGYEAELGPDPHLAAKATARREKAMWHRIARAGGFDAQPPTEPGPEAVPVRCPACGNLNGFSYCEWEEQPAHAPPGDEDIALRILAGEF